MSSILPTSLTSTTGATPVDQANIPADIRKAGPKAQQLYETALSFEQVMLQQLTSALQTTTQSDGSDDSSGDSSDDGSSDGSDATTNTMMQMLPNAFAQGLTSSGGVGIARELYDAMKANAGITSGSSAETESK